MHAPTATIDLQGVATLLKVYDMLKSLKFYCDILGFN